MLSLSDSSLCRSVLIFRHKRIVLNEKRTVQERDEENGFPSPPYNVTTTPYALHWNIPSVLEFYYPLAKAEIQPLKYIVENQTHPGKFLSYAQYKGSESGDCLIKLFRLLRYFPCWVSDGMYSFYDFLLRFRDNRKCFNKSYLPRFSPPFAEVFEGKGALYTSTRRSRS